MKILLVSSSILPHSGGSSIIVENLAENFNKDDLLVLGARGFRAPNFHRDQQMPEFRYFFSELSVFGRGARFFNWFRKLRSGALERYIGRLIDSEEITHVVGVYPNEYYCLSACRAATKMKVSFSSYFHNTYVENSAIVASKAKIVQAEIFDHSDQIFVMSDGMRRFYEKKYQLNKFVPLVHTFKSFPDESSFSGVPGENQESYNLVAIGNFNESNIEATRRFLVSIKNNPKYSLDLYTHVPNVLLAKRGLDLSTFTNKGAVHPSKIHEILQEYDVCILTHGFTGGYGDVEYQTIFPTRMIPFLLSGKPILAHSPSGSFLNEFLLENECAELVSEPDEEAVLSGLDRVTSDQKYQERLVENAQKAAKKFYGRQVAERMVTNLTRN